MRRHGFTIPLELQQCGQGLSSTLLNQSLHPRLANQGRIAKPVIGPGRADSAGMGFQAVPPIQSHPALGEPRCSAGRG